MRRAIPLIILFIFATTYLHAQWRVADDVWLDSSNLSVTLPDIVMQDIATPVTFKIIDPALRSMVHGGVEVIIDGEKQTIDFRYDEAAADVVFKTSRIFTVEAGSYSYSRHVTPVPLWLSVLPPLIAIIMALFFKEVYTALFIGVLVGTFIIFYYQGHHFFEALFHGFFAVIDTYVLNSLLDKNHVSIIIFSMMIGGMVGIITKNGGMKGVVNFLSRYANNARSGQLVTWVLGVMIFFDDYANTLVVGNTMRPITDKLKVSREKLAYIVDSTAAPIASIAFVTTWIGAELSYIQDGIKTLGLDETPYDVFLNSLQYSFYPILTLLFVLILVVRRRDFGPMHAIEVAARSGKVAPKATSAQLDFGRETEPDENVKARWYNAIVPVLVVIFGTITGLIITGLQLVGWDAGASFGTNLSHVIGSSDSFSALLWSSLGGVVVALVLTVGQRILPLRSSIDALVEGFKSMLTAVLILVLAWSIAMITEQLHTAAFISGSLIQLDISPYLVPALTFLLAAAISFSTGSSWGTMAILYPLILPATWYIGIEAELEYDTAMSIFHNVVSAVLAGSVMGDHCSPISDTTILSSLASSCDHISHVRTQMPYALTVGTVAIVLGTIPAAFGVSSLILFPVSLAVLALIIQLVGKPVPKAFLVKS
ncbi:MAG: Na+/H+ antiporter NhaC family protein [Bacteroidales bacterium]|nr:Na+/H+ antiporter NhaC family protein [Bacteroidales bacterium]MDD4175868.1 Na+/H+ antiporter NhaC family protein [Bacteroidales bacterium]MDD4740021.1 Na+/H+ antiporter NhaC family protein [Bacteroidales bacterium]MDY0333364.1 Na+/H+ antiporter NhaC family protein [Bacteroidales bacterium]